MPATVGAYRRTLQTADFGTLDLTARRAKGYVGARFYLAAAGRTSVQPAFLADLCAVGAAQIGSLDLAAITTENNVVHRLGNIK